MLSDFFDFLFFLEFFLVDLRIDFALTDDLKSFSPCLRFGTGGGVETSLEFVVLTLGHGWRDMERMRSDWLRVALGVCPFLRLEIGDGDLDVLGDECLDLEDLERDASISLRESLRS